MFLSRLLSQRTFIAIKPDGVKRGLIGQIITRFESKGFQLVAIKLTKPSKDFLALHYRNLVHKPFFQEVCDYMQSGPICAMVWEGDDIISQSRKMLGHTNPRIANPGTIRGDFAFDVSANVCHGADKEVSAVEEIDLWFDSREILLSSKAGSAELDFELGLGKLGMELHDSRGAPTTKPNVEVDESKEVGFEMNLGNLGIAIYDGGSAENKAIIDRPDHCPKVLMAQQEVGHSVQKQA